jgi:hypothetical protein
LQQNEADVAHGDYGEYWSILRRLTPAKVRAVKQFIARNKIEVLDSECDHDDRWCMDDEKTFWLRFRTRSEADYFKYTFDVVKPAKYYDDDTRYDHPWRREQDTLFKTRKQVGRQRNACV